MLCLGNKTPTSWYLLVIPWEECGHQPPFPRVSSGQEKKDEGEKRGKEYETGGGGGQLGKDSSTVAGA